MNYNQIELQNILFVDIETVPQFPNYEQLPENIKKHWDKKSQYISRNDETAEEIYNRAGIYSEFGKIIVIAFGYLRKSDDNYALIIKSLSNNNENILLSQFNTLLDKYFNTDNHYLCAHNGKEFDFPYIARRSIVNNIKIAKILNTQGLKPWETRYLDTLEMWKFGDYKHYVSLDLLTQIFNIDSPKDDIDGSMVNEIYWKENDLQRIELYCRKDVVALAQVFLRLIGKPTIDKKNIIFK